MVKKIKPNVVAGGSAIDLGNGLFYMRGRTHKQGGIDIGKNPRTGIEVENGEIYDVYKGRVFSAQPIFNGISPANALLMGGNPNSIFNAQELWKQEHRVNDDGTKFKDGGYTPSKEIIDYIKKTEAFRDKWYKDGNGIDTIGYGFTGSKVKKLFPNGITREQADKYFADSINRRIQILAKDTPNWNNLSQQQRDALLSYHYNVGEGSYRNNHPKLQEALRKQDWENVILNMDAGYNDKKNPGLRTRRDYERQLFRSGINSSSTGDEEKNFRDWYDTYARAHNLDLNPDAKEHYYDYRAYYKNRTKEQANEEWKLDSHLPDTYKLPGHPTFSIESIYSTRKTPGGTWKKVGLGPIYDERFVDSKYTKRLKTYKNVSFKYGGIHIKPSKRGTFTAAAKRHNMDVQEFARTVLNNKANYSAAMIKKANFARNASKWNKKEFGGDMTKQYFITPNNIYKLGGDIRRKAALGTDDNIYERYYDNGTVYYKINDNIFTKEEFARINGISPSEIDSRFTFRDLNYIPKYTRNSNIIVPKLSDINESLAKPEFYKTVSSAFPNPDYNPGTGSIIPKSSINTTTKNPRYSKLNIALTKFKNFVNTQNNTIKIDTSGRPTRGLGVTPLRPYDGRPIEAQAPASGSPSSSTGGQRRAPTVASTPTSNSTPVVNQTPTQPITPASTPATTPATTRISPYPTLEPLTPIASPGAVTPQTIVDNNRRSPIRLRGNNVNIRNGINIRNGADWLGLGINLAGNLAASLINRSAIKGMKYTPAPIPLSAQKLKTKINVNPQLDQIRENVAGQERLIADNTTDSRVALARRQRVRNLGSEQFQSLIGQRENMETQLINRDRLNRQGIDTQNVTQYNRWRRGAYDFENRRREMLAENAVAGINNAAEAIAGERGILARREGRNRDILNAALIAATSPNAQNVIGSKEFAKFLEQLGYTGDFSLLRKRLNIG